MSEKLVEKIKQGLNKQEQAIINEAIQALKKQFSEGDFVLGHCLRTGLALKQMGVSPAAITAGILHHLPEEKTGPAEKILKKVMNLQELCEAIKMPKLPALKKWQKGFLNTQANRTARMFFALTGSLDPIFILLAERLDEMKRIEHFAEKEQKKKANLALQMFAPLAYGMGMGELKGEFEDLAFPVLYNKEYQWLLGEAGSNYEQRAAYLKRVRPKLEKILKQEHIEALDINARAKHYFSLYQKLLRYEMDISKIYDLVAMRIIVPRIEDCYQTMGAIHKEWSPLSQRIKDYIASPKPNGYRSLHTTVNCLNNQKIEFQIKTPAMHQEAEYGAAAHLSYKGKIRLKKYKHQFLWLERLRQWQAEIHEPARISEDIRSELFKDRVLVFTPQKDIIDLPKGATAIDFAFAVHTEVGLHCQGAKADGKMIPLDKKLKTGQTIEILIDKNQTPSLDWLRFVKSKGARSKIKIFFQKAYGIVPKKPSKAAIIKDKVKAIKKALPFQKKEGPRVLVGGAKNIKVKFSLCCFPKQGDDIVAFITVGEGASLHKKNCGNLKELQQKWPQRVIAAKWQGEKNWVEKARK